VLVVDDYDQNRLLLRRILEQFQVHLVELENGAEALEYLRREEPPDLVLMDVQMPVLNGLEATRLIRGELGLADLPILAITAGVLDNEEALVREAGMNGHVSKPLDVGRLIAEIERLIGA
jgi:CheY-like chemotaxis protein